MTEEITFKSLPEDVQKALKLLKKVKEKAIEGVGNHDKSLCPVARGYGVVAGIFWGYFCENDATTLRNEGWDRIIYNSFMAWYDYLRPLGSLASREPREDFLKKYLSQ